MRKTRLTSFEEFKKAALKEPGLRRALAEPDEDPFLEVAFRLVSLRRELGLTQAQLARRIGIPQQTLARLESLRYKGHSLKSLYKVAQACGRRLRIEFVPAHKA
jgi:DNA-binding XRE family transcriptional regulator